MMGSKLKNPTKLGVFCTSTESVVCFSFKILSTLLLNYDFLAICGIVLITF